MIKRIIKDDFPWTFKFEAEIGQRILRKDFTGIDGGFNNNKHEMNAILWWDRDNRRWIHHDDFPWGKDNKARNFNSSSSAPCRSFKAFKRHLRRHRHILEGRELRLNSRYKGFDIIAIPKDRK